MSKLIYSSRVPYPDFLSKGLLKKYTLSNLIVFDNTIQLGILDTNQMTDIVANLESAGVYFQTHDELVYFLRDLHYKNDILFFNIMRVVADLASGYDVEIKTTYGDDMALSLFEDILLTRYGIVGSFYDAVNDIADVSYSGPIKQDLDRFYYIYESGAVGGEDCYGTKIEFKEYKR